MNFNPVKEDDPGKQETTTIIKRIVYAIIFAAIISIRELIQAVDMAGKTGAGIFGYLWAILKSLGQGLFTALGSAWQVITSPGAYLANHYWGSIIFSAFTTILLFLFMYQPMSLLLNSMNDKNGGTTSPILIVLATILVTILISGIAYYLGGAHPLTSNPNPPPVQNITLPPNNVTNTTNGGNIISLL